MHRHCWQRQQQLVFDQRKQIERLLTHKNRFIPTRQLFGGLVAFYKPHITFTVDRHHDLFQATLTHQRCIYLIPAMHGGDTLFVAREVQLDLYITRRRIQQRSQTPKTGRLHHAFQRDSAVYQPERLDVRGYGSRHKRAILGGHAPPVKTI